MTRFAEREFDDRTLHLFERELLLRYPFVRKERIGYSLLGRELCAYSVGKGSALIAAVFHACERVTGAILMRWLFEKAAAFKRGDPCSFTAVPLMNPDGAEIALYGYRAAERYGGLVRRLSKGDTSHWQSNARGVDLNHNFNAGFVALRENEIKNGFICRGPTRFCGGAPETEPETRALCDFCRRRDFSCAVALHSQGREIYCDFDHSAPEGIPIAKRMSAVSGYRLSSPSGTAVGGGFKDWFCQQFRRPGFTVEIGKGTNPLPKETADTEYKRVRKILDIAVGL